MKRLSLPSVLGGVGQIMLAVDMQRMLSNISRANCTIAVLHK